jgi:UrcA family protein
MFRSVRFSVIAAMGIIAAAQSAFAASDVKRIEVGRVTVKYADLDLDTRADARVMLTRLQKAAFRACGGDPRLHPDYSFMWPYLEKVYQDCRNDAVSRAVGAVNAPLLTEVHRNEGTQRLARATKG